jgi:hypothetical protein
MRQKVLLLADVGEKRSRYFRAKTMTKKEIFISDKLINRKIYCNIFCLKKLAICVVKAG